MVVRHYIPKHANPESSFLDSVYKTLEDRLQFVDEYVKGNTKNTILHIDDCTLLLRRLDTQVAKDLNETVSIMSKNLKNIEFTKRNLEKNTEYQLIK